jgi:hypothetical protein
MAQIAQKDITMNPEIKSGKGRGIIITVLSLALVAMVAVAGYLYWQNMQLKKNPQEVALQQVKDIVTKVGRLILLPDGETPTIATVTDSSLLKDQPFFNKSQKGDQILIYTNAKEAILYRPSTNIIINVAPLNIGSATTPTTAAAPTTPAKPTTKP